MKQIWSNSIVKKLSQHHDKENKPTRTPSAPLRLSLRAQVSDRKACGHAYGRKLEHNGHTEDLTGWTQPRKSGHKSQAEEHKAALCSQGRPQGPYKRAYGPRLTPVSWTVTPKQKTLQAKATAVSWQKVSLLFISRSIRLASYPRMPLVSEAVYKNLLRILERSFRGQVKEREDKPSRELSQPILVGFKPHKRLRVSKRLSRSILSGVCESSSMVLHQSGKKKFEGVINTFHAVDPFSWII